MLSRYLYAEVLTGRVLARMMVCTHLPVMSFQEVRGRFCKWIVALCKNSM